jgi:hypothetical protein
VDATHAINSKRTIRRLSNAMAVPVIVIGIAMAGLILVALRAPMAGTAIPPTRVQPAMESLDDYALRHPELSAALSSGSLDDYALRHPELSAALSSGSLDDYALRHPELVP